MTSLSSIADEQLSGLTGRKTKFNRNLAIISQIPAAREIEKVRQVEKKQEKQLAAQNNLQRQNAEIAETQANRAALLQGGTTLGQAAYLTREAWLPAAKNALGLGEAALNPDAAAKATQTALDALPAPSFANVAPAPGINATPVPLAEAAQTAVAPAAEAAATGLAEAAGEAIPQAVIDSGIDISGTIVGEGAATAGAEAASAAGSGALSTISSAVSTAIPYVGIAALSDLADKYITRPIVDKIVGDEGTKEAVNVFLDIHNPIRPLARLGGCIIITACTSPDAPEVQIAREYRDAYLSVEQLRGYYIIAETVVPLIQRRRVVKRLVKRYLVDSLVAVGRYELQKSPARPSFFARRVTRSFLKLCRFIGRRRTSFVRANGETV